MAYVIALPCVGAKNAACLVTCPCDSIHPTRDEPGFADAKQLYINPDSCIDCGLCASECPARAVFAESDLPAEWAGFAAVNAAYYQDGRG
jgi:ferredoxin